MSLLRAIDESIRMQAMIGSQSRVHRRSCAGRVSRMKRGIRDSGSVQRSWNRWQQVARGPFEPSPLVSSAKSCRSQRCGKQRFHRKNRCSTPVNRAYFDEILPKYKGIARSDPIVTRASNRNSESKQIVTRGPRPDHARASARRRGRQRSARQPELVRVAGFPAAGWGSSTLC